MTAFNQSGQHVAYQYNAAGDINLGAVQNSQELLGALEKLQRELGTALAQGALGEDAATDAEYHMKKAVQQAAKPAADKEGVLGHLGRVKALVSGAKVLFDLAKGIDWAMEKIRELL